MSIRRALLKVSARVIFAIFMTLAGGVLVGAFLLRALLFYPQELTPSQPEGTHIVEN